MDFLYFYELIMIIGIRPEVQDLNWPIEWAIVKIVFTFVVSDSMQELTIEYVEIASANIFCIRLELRQIQFCIIRKWEIQLRLPWINEYSWTVASSFFPKWCLAIFTKVSELVHRTMRPKAGLTSFDSEK